jgi:hypothetical protein
MPAKKKPELTGDELAALRPQIRDALAEQGLSPEALAKRTGRKVETVTLCCPKGGAAAWGPP